MVKGSQPEVINTEVGPNIDIVSLSLSSSMNSLAASVNGYANLYIVYYVINYLDEYSYYCQGLPPRNSAI